MVLFRIEKSLVRCYIHNCDKYSASIFPENDTIVSLMQLFKFIVLLEST